MRRNDYAAAGLHGRRDGASPIRQEARDGVLQAFRRGQLGRLQLLVAGVPPWPPFVARVECWWRDIVAAPPDQDLLIAEARGSLGLVQALQRAVVAFIQPPGVLHRDPR